MPYEPIRFLVEMKAAAGKSTDLRQFLEGFVAEVKLEEGCVGAHLMQDGADPDAYVLEEQWESREHRRAFQDAMEEAGVNAGLKAYLARPAITRSFVRLV
jgi:quinol monooxygenase YgiN